MRDLYRPGRSLVHAANGMAATSQPLASAAAIAVLQAGGNAMDAAVAAVAVQCVVEPQSTGVGGDCFCLYVPGGSGDVVAYNGSGRAPAGLNAGWFADHGLAGIDRHGPHAVTVPGSVDAWARLLADHGTMSLGELLQPAIRYAADGFPINHRTQYDWQLFADLLAADATSAAHYLHAGKVPEVGALVKLPLLARTLEQIAEAGRDGFYGGWVAEDIVAHLQSLGGVHTMADFAAAHGQYVTPIKTDYRGYEVYECPPNGQGVVALAMLNILGGCDLGSLAPLSAERLHLEIEAARIAYADRDAVLGDPDTSEVPVDTWLSAEHADKCRALIDRAKRLADLPPSELPGHQDTVYLTVVDKDRNAVSFINSLFFPFGGGIMAPRSGVHLHNRGYGFNLIEGHPNCIAGGKRPLHTIIPGMLMKDGRAQMPFGVMGGQYQAAGHVHLLNNLLEWDMDLQQAVDLARVFPDVADPAGAVQVEPGLPAEALAGLRAMGHETYVPARPIGGAQAIWIDWQEGVLRGASEPRKDGCAIGY